MQGTIAEPLPRRAGKRDLRAWKMRIGAWKEGVGVWKMRIGAWKKGVGVWKMRIGAWKEGVGVWVGGKNAPEGVFVCCRDVVSVLIIGWKGR